MNCCELCQTLKNILFSHSIEEHFIVNEKFSNILILSKKTDIKNSYTSKNNLYSIENVMVSLTHFLCF